MRKTYTGILNELPENGIFVFGANTEGRHGLGAAKVAREKFGAIYGRTGLMNKSYGIITKDLTKKVHPSIDTETIVDQIEKLYTLAIMTPEKDYYVAYSGEGKNLNAYSPQEMADMFRTKGFLIPENIIFEEGFSKLIFKYSEADILELLTLQELDKLLKKGN